jgi:PAS domain S-box-containing protein
LESIDQNVTDVILESISDGVFTIDHDWRITSFNHAAEIITGISREEAMGKNCWDVFRSNMCERDCALRRTMKEDKSFIDSLAYIVNSEKRRIPVVVCTAPLKSKNGNLIGGVETFRDMSLVEELRKEIDKRYQIGDMISGSPAMQTIFQLMPQVSESDSTVFIHGETGTGKELLARAIHNLSPRRDHPFYVINCGALPDTLLESELFGYKAGAFTNAVKDKPGYFSLANGGTVFLDEIGDTSPAFQVRLLRVLQDRIFQPLGATESVKTNIRVITATNKDLEQLIKNGTFREDLYYRINVLRLELPPLRERKEDIPLLIEHFINRLNMLRGKTFTGLSHEALTQIMAHNFPGNIRELENIVEHAFALSRESQIELSALPDYLKTHSQQVPENLPMGATLKSFEAEKIEEVLRRNDYNRLAAAAELGVHKSTLFRKIKSLGIQLPNKDGRSKRQN